ncbi:hypothetical protein [Microvirga arabica]|uniref:hypothetical protein n=1 Tax=Microvirga arabica TaxID=1128671 RepID=UPI00193A3222|nr:hypothetical protein [Microvirga arabica]MBM1169973.1 hypothetical protein [Microvirga arabica]
MAAVLPIAAADRYAAVLTDADVATLKHLAGTGMGANTLRAPASDLPISRLCAAPQPEAHSHARPIPSSS